MSQFNALLTLRKLVFKEKPRDVSTTAQDPALGLGGKRREVVHLKTVARWLLIRLPVHCLSRRSIVSRTER